MRRTSISKTCVVSEGRQENTERTRRLDEEVPTWKCRGARGSYYRDEDHLPDIGKARQRED